MTKVVSDLLTNVDSGYPSLLLSLDISAAFDTLNHKRLLQRAQDLFGFMGQANLWLASYLSDRNSFVSMGASKSNTITHSTAWRSTGICSRASPILHFHHSYWFTYIQF